MKVLSIILLLFSNSLFAANLYFCNQPLDDMPIQTGGRVKPLYVHANESVKFLTGKSKIGELNATTVYCLLTLEGMGVKNDLKLTARIEHSKLQEKLNIKESNVLYEDIVNEFSEIRSEYMMQKENNSYKKSLSALLSKIELYQSITSAQNWMVAVKKDGEITWQPFSEAITKEEVSELSKTSLNPILTILDKSREHYKILENDHYLIELSYAKARLFSWSMLTCLIALIFFFTQRGLTIGFIFLSLTLGLEMTGLILRILISGRAPITNMYETVMFSGFGGLIIALIIYQIKKEKIFISAGLAYNVLCLMMMQFANNMLDSSIKPLVPVLRDNFWLSTHVTCIILSYGALALSWMLANLIMIQKILGKSKESTNTHYAHIIHTSLKYGIVLLSAGIILGGVWADYSWGRFWGWDPKETWSLIVLLIYMAILHGRYTNWISPQRFIPLTAGAFLSVMMAWFGVNYILASGLHSYGFSQGGAIFLMSFALVQLVILGIYVTSNHLKSKQMNA